MVNKIRKLEKKWPSRLRVNKIYIHDLNLAIMNQ